MTTAHGNPSGANTTTYRYTYAIRPAALSDLHYLPAIESSAANLFTSIPELSHLAGDEPMSVEAHLEVLRKWRDGGVSLDLGGQGGGTWVVVAQSGEDGNGDGSENGEDIVGFVVTELLPMVRESEHGTLTSNAQGYFLHIDELSISAAYQRRGLARRLLQTVKDFAGALGPSSSRRGGDGDGLPVLGLSLTTFRNVPFNAPFYEKFGFKEVEREQVGSVVGVGGARIWREDRERFEGEGHGGSRSGLGARRCWMVCWL